MKLAEALIERADLQKRAAQLQARLQNNLKVQEGEAPAEDPRQLLQEFMEVAAALEALLPRIHRANLAATLPNGQTLTDALVSRDLLDLRLTTLRQLVAGVSTSQERYSRSELKLVATLPAREVQAQADALAKARRELEVQIQQANWQTDLP